ncbi:MAG TPA: type II secretion system protein GspC [Candidatus Binataceae bacterium]|jgi:type II secretion system protein C|nr:type II secretion system protein GspC [Candidatus Binataceae bacterium]
MTLRLAFSERYLTALNLLLIAALAYFLALSVNDVIRGRLGGGAPLELPALTRPRPVAAQARPRAYYEAIVRRDIFNLEPAPETPAETATNLHIKLIGTSQLTLSRPFIIVLDQNTQRQSLYRLGDEIPEAGKLVGVYKDHAIILHQGRRIKLEMPAAPVPAASDARALPYPWAARSLGPGRPFSPLSGRGVRPLGPGRFAVDRLTLNDNLRNMASLFTQIRAIPNIGADGSSDGFRLSEIQPGSIFDQVGLHDGDILTSVDGQTVSDPARAMQMLGSLRNQSTINLTVLRNGQPLQLHYDIH